MRRGAVVIGAKSGTRLAGLVCVGALLTLGGCLGSPKPAVQLFTLPPLTEEDGVTGGVTQGPSMGVGPVVVAPYLEQPYVARRLDLTRVEFADSARWVAPLDQLIRERIISQFALVAGASEILTYPWPQSRPPQTQLTLRVQEFAILPDNSAVLLALWTLRDGDTGALLASSPWNTKVMVDGTGSSAEVMALSQALDELATFLIGEVAALQGR
jgi:uncharacterized lipoprotein YmbA